MSIKSLSTETKIALSVAVIALCALCVSMWQGYTSREHDRLSVKPHMVISFDYDDTGAGFTMSNGGVGPAIIRSFAVCVDSKPAKSWFDVGEIIGFQKPFPWFIRVPSPHTSWMPGEPKKIFLVSSSPAIQILKANHNRIVVSICYCSLYDECWLRANTVIEPQPIHCKAEIPPQFRESSN